MGLERGFSTRFLNGCEINHFDQMVQGRKAVARAVALKMAVLTSRYLILVLNRGVSPRIPVRPCVCSDSLVEPTNPVAI